MTARLTRIATLLMFTLIPAGCSAPPAAHLRQHETRRATPLEQPPVAVLPDGTHITLELAITPEEHEKGLMFRPFLATNHGMLFLFDTDTILSFWMKNTLIPLDIVFLDDTGHIVSIAAGVPPCAADPCPQYRSKGPSRAVLELAAGTSKAHHLTAGSTITFERVPDYPIVSAVR